MGRSGKKLAGVGLVLGIIAFSMGLFSIAISFIPIIGWCMCTFFSISLLIAISGIIVSIVALVMGAGSSKGKAILGLVLSLLFFMLPFLMVLLWILFGIGRAMI